MPSEAIAASRAAASDDAAAGDEAGRVVKAVAAIAHALPATVGPAAIEGAMRAAGEALGAPHHMMARYDPTADDLATLVVATNFPLDYVVEYAARRHDKIDPTLAYVTRVDRPFRWAEAHAAMPELSDRQAVPVVELARSRGVADGWTFPIAGRQGVAGGAVFSGPGPYDWSRETVAAVWGLVQVLWWAHAGASGASDGEPPRVTVREREVLALLAEGLVSRGIAERMGISATTVDWHIAQLSEKAGARNRQHLVAIAMRSGLIA